MKISKLVKQFSVEETRWVKCPFIKDLELEIARAGCQRYVERMRERSKDNPILKEFMNTAYRSMAATEAKMAPKVQAEILNSLDVGPLLGDSLVAEDQKKDIAEILIRNWRGAVVEGIIYEPSECVEMLGDTAPLGLDLELGERIYESGGTEPANDEDKVKRDNRLILEATQTIGDALTLWVQWESNNQDRYREKWIEAQAKNSERSSLASLG